MIRSTLALRWVPYLYLIGVELDRQGEYEDARGILSDSDGMHHQAGIVLYVLAERTSAMNWMI